MIFPEVLLRLLVLTVTLAAGIGAAVGALMSVPAYRFSIERGQRVACVNCGERLRWVCPGGRCASCRARLGPSVALLVPLGAVICAGLGWRLGASPALLPFLLVGLLGLLLAMIDLAAQRLPDALVLPGLVAVVVGFGILAAVAGGWQQWLRALLGGLAYALTYLVLALLPGGQLGFGDVKLAALLGVCLGWLGWPVLVAGAVLPWLLNAPVAVGKLLRTRSRSATTVPFGPAMLVGAFVAIVVLPAIGALLAS
jgi:leader peptidase (prepilin peptidase)/N-methyltransferase